MAVESIVNHGSSLGNVPSTNALSVDPFLAKLKAASGLSQPETQKPGFEPLLQDPFLAKLNLGPAFPSSFKLQQAPEKLVNPVKPALPKPIHYDAYDEELEEYQKYRNDPRLQMAEAKQFFKHKRELCFSGGGGAGGALADAIIAAVKCGLELNDIERVNATSVGVFIAMAIVLEIPVNELKTLLEEMPRETFQDWDWWQSINNMSKNWAWCEGKVMTQYFRDVIEERTGLKDPTFKELHDAGFKKEFCINTTNLSTGSVSIFSHRRTPNKKIAETMTLACTVPGVFPPKWIIDRNGQRGLHADGGILCNFPFGLDRPPHIKDEDCLGFVFVNEAAGYGKNGDRVANIESFWGYMKQVFWVFISKHPLSLPDNIKDNTVAVSLNHPPLIFDPTEKQQKHLSRAGEMAVYRAVLAKLPPIKSENKQVFSKMASAVDVPVKQGTMPLKPLLPSKDLQDDKKPYLPTKHRAELEKPAKRNLPSPFHAPAA